MCNLGIHYVKSIGIKVLVASGTLAYVTSSMAALPLPCIETYNGTGTAFSITQTGTGRAVAFAISNTANGANAVEIDSNGTSAGDALNVVATGNGDCGYFEIIKSTSSAQAIQGRTNGTGAAIYGRNTGTGKAGYFEITNAANTNDTLQAYSNGGGEVVQAINTGTGKAGYFEVSNSANTKAALESKTNGTGSALTAVNTGTGGAGYFETSNDTSAHIAVEVKTQGTGSALDVVSSNKGVGNAANFVSFGGASTTVSIENVSSDGAGDALQTSCNGTGSALYAMNDGLGRAGYFEIDNSESPTDVLQSITNGPGRAGYFENQWDWDPTTEINDIYTCGLADQTEAVWGRMELFEINPGYAETTAYGQLGGLIPDAFWVLDGCGVYGEATKDALAGVYARGYGQDAIIGEALMDEWGNLGRAGSFAGDVDVYGVLTKGGGAFKIDHPLDPANKYLSHSFVESPDMMNIYNGNVVTNDEGYAEVVMPEWFEALNRDFRYQLTILDPENSDDFVQAKVVRKIEDNRFTLRTSAPHVEVSWMVTGIRHDAWAEVNRIPVEEAKPDDERGKYRHPELYSRPIEERIGYIPRRTDTAVGTNELNVAPTASNRDAGNR